MAHASSPQPPADAFRRGLRLLGMSIRLEPVPFAIAVVGAVVFAAALVGAAVVLGRITDHVLLPAFERGGVGGSDPRSPGFTLEGAVVAAAAAILAVGLLKALGIVLRRTAASAMQFRLQARFRRQVTRQYQRLPLAWHRRHPTGELLSNANADVEASFWPIAPLPLSVGVLFILLFTTLVLAFTDILLTAIGLFVLPATTLLTWRYNQWVGPPAARAQQRRADLSHVAHESFDGALVVKTLGREGAETERFAREANDLRGELVRVGRIRAVYDPLMEILPQAAVLVVLLAGTWRLAAGALTPGELVQFAYLFTILGFPLRVLGWLLSDLPRAVVGWSRVQRVLDATGEMHYGIAAPRGDGPAEVAVSDVAFAYDHKPILHGVTLDVSAGKTVAIVGATGSGKSSLTSLLVRLVDPDAGTVLMDQLDLRSIARNALSQSSAIVLQESFLFDDTVRANITLDEPYSDAEVEWAAHLAHADEFIRSLPRDYETVIGERGTTLSGGQRQRLALARALIRRPRLLILDDATSHVDPAVEAGILAALREAELGATVILVAYRPATIALADEVVYVEAGTVQARGSHAEVLDTVPAYARLVTAYDLIDLGRSNAEEPA